MKSKILLTEPKKLAAVNALLALKEKQRAAILASIANGATIKDAVEGAKISIGTYRNWVNEDPAFAGAVKAVRGAIIELVQSAMYKRALGYNFKEVTTEDIVDKFGHLTGEKKTKVVTKHSEGNVGAQIFILCNRASDEWKNPNSVVDINLDNPIEEYLNKSEKEIDALIAAKILKIKENKQQAIADKNKKIKTPFKE